MLISSLIITALSLFIIEKLLKVVAILSTIRDHRKMEKAANGFANFMKSEIEKIEQNKAAEKTAPKTKVATKKAVKKTK